jgi:aspartyl-tRNA synthetase
MQKRTHTCGELTQDHIGENVILMGWVNNWRDHGGLLFIDLRDRYGITQLVFNPDQNEKLHHLAQKLRHEYVISVAGQVQARPTGMQNKSLFTGEIEIHAKQLDILNTAKTTPFEISDQIDVHEELRLEYRYLDLRRSTLQRNLLLRSKLYKIVRDYLSNQQFVEIETPFLMKSTPEGARDFLVPSRNYTGKFYALPQSPQTYKQILMVSGFDRYFQIVKCFRDEDLRRDRQPEFTQIDLEMSFVAEDDVMSLSENLIKEIYKKLKNNNLKETVPRMTYQEAMSKYGSDKPDTRFEMCLHDLTGVFEHTKFKVFNNIVRSDGIIAGLVAENSDYFSRKKLDGLSEYVQKFGVKGLVWFRVTETDFEGPTVKFFSKDEKQTLKNVLNLKPGHVVCIIAGETEQTLNVLGELRLYLGRELNLIDTSTDHLLWITDFPMLEYDEAEQRYVARHHPFTSPQIQDLDLLSSDPEKVKARAYDLVLNGNEIAGGSIRIHTTDLQKRVFQMLNISPEESDLKFGFLLKALDMGAPPHGGIAFGFDRLTMLLVGAESLREVIAFPKTTSALSLMDGSPSPVDQQQLSELGLSLINE